MKLGMHRPITRRDFVGGVFFGKETFGDDRLAVAEGRPSWREFLAKTPLSETAQEEIARLCESDTDYLEGLNPKEKVEFLQKTSYEKFLLETAGVGPEAVSYLWRSTTWAIGFANSDAVADAMTEGAFKAAHLAVKALVE
jgi:hypothetical protein